MGNPSPADQTAERRPSVPFPTIKTTVGMYRVAERYRRSIQSSKRYTQFLYGSRGPGLRHSYSIVIVGLSVLLFSLGDVFGDSQKVDRFQAAVADGNLFGVKNPHAVLRMDHLFRNIDELP